MQVKANVDNVAGVKLPRFELLNDGSGGKMDMTGLGKGGTQLQACRKKYLEARRELAFSVQLCIQRDLTSGWRAPRPRIHRRVDISLQSLQAIEVLIELASLQTAFLTLDAAIKTTNRRVNALENVVCPKLDNTVAYIKVWQWRPLVKEVSSSALTLCCFLPCPCLRSARYLPPRVPASCSLPASVCDSVRFPILRESVNCSRLIRPTDSPG